MKEFISSNCLMAFQFYGYSYRLDAIVIGSDVTSYVVSCRTSDHKDEFTKFFDKLFDARDLFSYCVHKHF